MALEHRAFYAGMLAAKRLGTLAERPPNPYREEKYRRAFARGVERFRTAGTLKVAGSRRV